MALPLMAMALAPSAMKGISSLASYFTRQKTPRFGSTDYGKYLQQLGEEGIYDPKTRRTMMGQYSRPLANIAQQRKSTMAGYLESIGLGDSIAGASVLGRPGRELQRGVGEYGERLTTENEASKKRALGEYARLGSMTDEQRRVEDANATANLVGGLFGAVGEGVGKAYQTKRMGELASYGAPEGEEYGPYAPYALAGEAGVSLPYYAGRETGKTLPMPDISGLSEEEAMRAMLMWMFQGGGR